MATNHLKPGQKSGFQMVGPSLDRFVMNKIFFYDLFCIKRSRLEVKKLRSGFQMVKTRWPTIRKPDPKSVREMAIRMPDRLAFGCILYLNYGHIL
jgi:hypothetical protein